MGLQSFEPDNTIFRDESVLRDGYQPGELIERDDELAEYQSALAPVINGAQPKNIFLYGETGVGKTLATQMVLDRLKLDQENIDGLEVASQYLVCKSMNSSYQVAVNLVNEFRDPANQINSTGYPAQRVYQMLYDEIEQLDATHCLIILDEIDSIGTDDDLLYQLPRCNDNNSVESTLVGVIGISNDFTFRDNLSARVQDSLCDEEIHFPPYDANQLRNILYQRADEAFHEGVLNDDVIPLCAATAAQKYGSARQALKRLYKAGDLARTRGDSTVTVEHVRDADGAVELDMVSSEIRQIPTQSKLTLLAMLKLHDSGETPVRRSDIYERYTIAANKLDVDTVSARTIHEKLSQLTTKGFLNVTERNEGPKGGSFYEYEFSIRPEIAAEALSANERLRELL